MAPHGRYNLVARSVSRLSVTIEHVIANEFGKVRRPRFNRLTVTSCRYRRGDRGIELLLFDQAQLQHAREHVLTPFTRRFRITDRIRS